MAGPRRVERRFQPSEGCALSFGRGAAKWYGRKDSNLQVSRFVAEYPVQLNDARVKTLWQREVDSNHCLPGQSRKSWPLNDPAVAGSGRIERPKLASKTSGLPLTELPLTLGWTGGNRTRVERATVFRSATDLRSTQNLGAWKPSRTVFTAFQTVSVTRPDPSRQDSGQTTLSQGPVF